VKFALLAIEVSELLSKRAFEEVKDHKGTYSLLFLVPKKSGGCRPVFDLSFLNKHLIIPRFKMESAVTIQRDMTKGTWAISLDIKDAYLHVPIRPTDRKYLKFGFQGRVYQFNVLPFGVAIAPYVFTRIVRAFASVVRQRGIQFHHYLDDWLIVAGSPSEAIRRRFCPRFGHQVRMDTKLGQVVAYPFTGVCLHGVQYDLRKGLAFPPVERVRAMLSLLNRVLSDRQTSARRFLSLIGLLASMEKQVPLGRCFMRPLQWCLSLQWRIASDPLDQVIQLNDRAVEALLWWRAESNTRVGMPLGAYLHDQVLFTDASEVAWGAHWNERTLSGVWTPIEKGLHINVLELRAVRRALEHWGELSPKGTNWLVFTDNSTVVAHINKQGGTRSLQLCLETEKLIKNLQQQDSLIKARHIPGCRNVLADALSRPNRVLGTEWSLCPIVFRQLCTVLGTPHIDLFATSKNHKLPVYVSPFPESGALATDAMALSWQGMFAYAYPPTRFVAEVLRKVAISQCEMLLVAPCWPTQSWFPLLLSLLIEHPRVLPVKDRLLMQPGTSVFHTSPGVLRLHVWKLSSDLSKAQAFRNKCRNICPGRIGHLPNERTKPNGQFSFVGALGDALIHSLPL